MFERLLPYNNNEHFPGKWEVVPEDLTKNVNVTLTLLNEIFKTIPEEDVNGETVSNLILQHPRFSLGVQKFENYVNNPVAVKWYFTLSPYNLLQFVHQLPKLNKNTFKNMILQVLYSYPPLRRKP